MTAASGCESVRELSNCANDAAFNSLVDQLVEKHLLLWEQSTPAVPEMERSFSVIEQRRNEKACEDMLADLERSLNDYPASPSQQLHWRQKLGTTVRGFCEQVVGYSDALLDTLFSSANFAATQDFVSKASEFDGGLSTDDLHQALRNTWVMNSIQVLLGCDVCCSHSVFAYSMLYPYTDNVLDNATLTFAQKRDFNLWLQHRLRGFKLAPRNTHERALSELVRLIECEHDRTATDEVFHSLLAIHDAQHNSLRQQNRRPKTESELLRISVRKGGTSVLAHGFLVNKSLTENEASFIFGYGVFLQLLDDLQDLRVDSENRHATLFTEASRNRHQLDAITSRLYRFMKNTLASASCFTGPDMPIVCELIDTNCRLLMLQAVVMHRDAFTAEFVSQVATFSPLGSDYYGKLPAKLRHRVGELESVFEKRHGKSIRTVLV